MMGSILWTLAGIAGVICLFNLALLLHLLRKNHDLISDALETYIKRGKRHGKK